MSSLRSSRRRTGRSSPLTRKRPVRTVSGATCIRQVFMLRPSAAYYVAFGPHGPRAPTSQPGDALKIFLGTMGLCGVALGVFLGIRSLGRSTVTCVRLSSHRYLASSTSKPQNALERVGGGDQRHCSGKEDEPHQRCVSISYIALFPDRRVELTLLRVF